MAEQEFLQRDLVRMEFFFNNIIYLLIDFFCFVAQNADARAMIYNGGVDGVASEEG
jgi:hypothetical protein